MEFTDSGLDPPQATILRTKDDNNWSLKYSEIAAVSAKKNEIELDILRAKDNQ